MALGVALLLLSTAAEGQPRFRQAQQLADAAVQAYHGRQFDQAARLFLQAHQLDKQTKWLTKAALAFEEGRQFGKAVNTYLYYLRVEPGGPESRSAAEGIKRLRRYAVQTHGEVIVRSTPPGATVMLMPDGVRLGVTPMKTWLEHGEKVLRLSFEGREPVVAQIDVRGEHTATLDTRLVETRRAATLTVTGIRSQDRVRVDGEPLLTLGRRSVSVTVEAGERRLTVRRADGTGHETTVTLRPAQAVTVDVAPSVGARKTVPDDLSLVRTTGYRDDSRGSGRVAGWVLVGLGVAGVGAGAALGLTSGHDLDTGLGVGSAVGYGVGGAALLTGIILLLVSD